MVLAILAGMTQAYAQDYKPNYLRNVMACKESRPFLSMLAAAQEGKHDAANLILHMAAMTGDCKMFPLMMYLPEAIVQQWDKDDGTGGPGVVVAGWVLGPEGEKRLRAFVWLDPEMLTHKWFGVEKPEA